MSLHTVIDIETFAELCQQTVNPSDYPLADSVQKRVLCYSGDTLRQVEHDPTLRMALLKELAHALQCGPGVIAIRAAYTDTALLTHHNQLFEDILRQESGKQSGDHFAKAGANGRIWNALQKIALADPSAFIDYYKNPVLALVAEAWLGPDYQLTSQVNIVRPGGQAQQPHRDYHLGFQSVEVLEHYPPHVHLMSAMLTLQGAVAHTDMPLESGPTMLLPFSQQYAQGYLAWRDSAFIDYFQQHAVQLPLQQGDAVFFNPALFHAAGTNYTNDFHRVGNLLQISSAFGRAMESVDHYAISLALYPALLEQFAALSQTERTALLTSACEAYSFPTNLDSDPPLGGMAPQTHKQLTEQALLAQMEPTDYQQALKIHQAKRQA